MFAKLPSTLRKATFAQIAGWLALSFSLLNDRPLGYVFTIGLGCLLLVTSLGLYFVFFVREIHRGGQNGAAAVPDPIPTHSS